MGSRDEGVAGTPAGDVDARGPSRRGFAGMDPVRQREIASLGGRAAHRSGHAHEFNSREASVAGRKGGLAGGGNRKYSEPEA